MFPCFAGKYSCAGGGRGFYDSPRAFKDAPRERRGISNILSHISERRARRILVVLVLVEIKAIKNARGPKATAGHRKHPCSRNTFKVASVIGCEKWNTTLSTRPNVVSSAEIKLISRRSPRHAFYAPTLAHGRAYLSGAACNYGADVCIYRMSHREIFQRYQGRRDLRFGYRAFRYLSRGLVFSRVYRVWRALVNSRDYFCIRLRRQPLEMH